MTRYFVAVGSDRTGPFTTEELLSGAAAPSLDGGTLVWAEGMPTWEPAERVEALAEVLRQRAAASSQAELPQAQVPTAEPPPPSRPITPAAVTDGDDFILLNPRLPRMAQAI